MFVSVYQTLGLQLPVPPEKVVGVGLGGLTTEDMVGAPGKQQP